PTPEQQVQQAIDAGNVPLAVKLAIVHFRPDLHCHVLVSQAAAEQEVVERVALARKRPTDESLKQARQALLQARALRDQARELAGKYVQVGWDASLPGRVERMIEDQLSGLDALATALEQAGQQAKSLVCPGLFPRVDVSGAEKFRIGLSMVGNRRRLFDIPLNDPHLFTSQPERIEFLRTDEFTLHQVTASFFLASRRMDCVLRDLPRISPMPLHLMIADDDDIIDAGQTVEFVRELRWPSTRITHYPDCKHTLEFESVREEYWGDLVDWLTSEMETEKRLSPSE
ncbi:MAG: alpha/beta hydrolase, partial [Planctomycetes bacterium]|nr:alpha/beta hydrolase [Planctomycetota bacterium]